MANYGKKLTKEDLIKAGIKDIYYDPDEARYHIIRNDGEEINLSNNKQKYLSFTVYDLDNEGNKIKRPIKVKYKYKGSEKEIDSYTYKGKPMTLSRCVYAWFHGEVPEGLIVDHIDNKHDTHYDNRLENLQLLTPGENLAKERPICRTEIPCDMKKPIEHYLETYNYWLMEYEREKKERSSSTKYAQRCKDYYNAYKKRIRYWFSHQKEYEDYIRLESARISAREFQQDRASKINQYKQEIKQAKKISKDLWHEKLKEYNEFLKNFPFKTAEELEKMFLEQLIK